MSNILCCAEFLYVDCHIFNVVLSFFVPSDTFLNVMLSVVMLNVVMQSVVKLSVILLSVVAPS